MKLDGKEEKNAFRLKNGTAPNRSHFQTAALVDVVFILLIFFVSVSTLKESRLDLNLPEVGEASPTEPEIQNEPLLIEVTAARDIFIDGSLTNPEALETRIRKVLERLGPKPRVRFLADEEARNREMMAVIGALAKVGLNEVEFGVNER